MRWVATLSTVVLLLHGFADPCRAAVALRRGQIDADTLAVGAFVHVTHDGDGDGGTQESAGYVKQVDEEALTIGRGLWRVRILRKQVIRVVVEDQDRVQLVPGLPLRITAPSIPGRRIVGRLTKVEGDGLLLRDSRGQVLAVPLADLAKLEANPGNRSYVWPGSLLGLAAGIGACALILDEKTSRYRSDWSWTGYGARSELLNAREACVVGLSCLALGVIAGRRLSRWTDLPIPDSVASPPDGLADAAATAAPLISCGARVRLRAPSVSTRRIVGRVLSVEADNLVVRIAGDGALREVPLASVVRLETSRGAEPKTVEGAILGLVAGVSTGAVMGYARGEHDCGWFAVSRKELAVCLGAGLGALGALEGGIVVGGLLGPEQWDTVRLDRIRLGICPQRRGRPLLCASFGL